MSFPDPGAVVAATVAVSCIPWSGAAPTELGEPIFRRRDGVTFVVPPDRALAPGSHTLVATVDLVRGGSESVGLDVAVRQRLRRPPLATPQWIQLDFDADRDGDARPDFQQDLAAFGLASGFSPVVDIRIEAWVIDEVVARAQAFYDHPNPSGLPDGDPIALHFSIDPPDSGPYTRICVAGETPEGGSIVGNVLLDPGNSDLADVACDDWLPSGVFPRELLYYEDEPAFQRAFGSLIVQPAGTHPLDLLLLAASERRGPRADDGADQRARFEELRVGVETFAQLVASVAAHEAGHAMGLVPPGSPGRGLFGGEDDVLFTHNLDAAGEVPGANLLMNPGPTFGFEELAGIGPAGLPRLRTLNFAYLQGRLLLDPAVDEILMPPHVRESAPAWVDRNGAPVAMLEVVGEHFGSSARITLHGLTSYAVPQAGVLPGRDGAPDTMMATLLVPGLLPGVYALEITNSDGQSHRLENAIQVR